MLCSFKVPLLHIKIPYKKKTPYSSYGVHGTNCMQYLRIVCLLGALPTPWPYCSVGFSSKWCQKVSKYAPKRMQHNMCNLIH